MRYPTDLSFAENFIAYFSPAYKTKNLIHVKSQCFLSLSKQAHKTYTKNLIHLDEHKKSLKYPPTLSPEEIDALNEDILAIDAIAEFTVQDTSFEAFFFKQPKRYSMNESEISFSDMALFYIEITEAILKSHQIELMFHQRTQLQENMTSALRSGHRDPKNFIINTIIKPNEMRPLDS